MGLARLRRVLSEQQRDQEHKEEDDTEGNKASDAPALLGRPEHCLCAGLWKIYSSTLGAGHHSDACCRIKRQPFETVVADDA